MIPSTQKLRAVLDDATNKWGIKVNRVELQDITPPVSVLQAMEKQMQAERNKRATILNSEGEKAAVVLRSEGEKTSMINRAEASKQQAILKAEGEAQARIRKAEAEAIAIKQINRSCRRYIKSCQLFVSSKVYCNATRTCNRRIRQKQFTCLTKQQISLVVSEALKIYLNQNSNLCCC